MGANLSKMDYVSNFTYNEPDQYSSDDGIEFNLCIFGRVGIPIYTVSSDSDID